MNKNVCRPTSACEPAHGIQDDKKPVEYHPVRVRLVTIIVTGICVLVNFTDGFDLVAMAVAAPLIAAEFALTPTILGFLFSRRLWAWLSVRWFCLHLETGSVENGH